jgi:hypothetical protein
MRPFMYGTGDLSDGWERFANALEPILLFSKLKRIQLSAIFVLILLVSLFIKSKHVVQGPTLIGGLVFFQMP